MYPIRKSFFKKRFNQVMQIDLFIIIRWIKTSSDSLSTQNKSKCCSGYNRINPT